MPNLTIRENGSEAVYQMPDETATIGRGEHNDVQLTDPRASKEHCRIVQVDDRWKLIDLESHNGTRVNGDFRNKAWLGHGDTIVIGQCEIRFGVEGRSRSASRPASRTTTSSSAAGSAAGVQVARPAAGEDDAPLPPSRYGRGGGGDKLLIFGGALLGAVLLVVWTANIVSKTARDSYNEKVLEQGERYVENGQFDEAQAYLDKNADASGSGYQRVLNRIREIEEMKPQINRAIREHAANRVLSRMANKIANYDRGGSAEPSDILARMKRLKTEYAGTEQDLAAAQRYPEWYAGRVPGPAIDRKDPRRKLKKEWDAVCEQADGYRKQEHFREARETLERFVRVRETTLEAVDLKWLQGESETRIGNIERLAGTYFSSVERRARDLVKKKRFDQAIALYKEVIANYGIDKYVRKAKEAIAEVEEARRKQPGNKPDDE